MNVRPHLAHDPSLLPRPSARVARVAHEDRGFQPRGLRREDAAWYLGVSTTKFDDWVSDGTMPAPKKKGGVVVWDRRQLDEAFEALPDRDAESKQSPFKDIG